MTREHTNPEPTPDVDVADEPAASAPMPREQEHVEIHVVDAETGEEPADGADDVIDVEVVDELAAAEAAIDADISRVMSERDDYLDALRRLQADFENYKKRVMKQQTEHLERAAEDLIVQLLPVLDAGEMARAHGGGDAVVQVTTMLYETLAKEGLESIDADVGTAFDPTVHEAVAHEPGDGGEAHISELLRAGYRWKGRLVRPAMVKVKG